MSEIESLPEIYTKAVFTKDIESYVSIYDDKVRVFDMWEAWSCDGLEAWQNMAEGWFNSLGPDKDLVEFADIQIETSGELATVTAFVKFTAVSEKGEELRYLQNRLTWIVRKKDGAWKIIHQHTSGPINFETMKVILKK
jgi:ketosteroid isomerase-like protein